MNDLFGEQTSINETLGQSPTLCLSGETPNNDGLFAVQTAGATGAIIPEGADTMKACFHSSGLGHETPPSQQVHPQRLTLAQQLTFGKGPSIT